MTEVERILDQYDRIVNGDAWHGDPVWKVLDGVSAEFAAARPVAGLHTIWELVGHMTFWETEVTRRLHQLPPRPEKELNFPRMPEATESNWQTTLAAFRESNGAFREAVSRVKPAQLDEERTRHGHTIYGEAHGVLQHHAYHAGQIALLRRFFDESQALAGL